MNDDKVDAYLFDPSADATEEVRAIEDSLRPLRYDDSRTFATRMLRGGSVAPYPPPARDDTQNSASATNGGAGVLTRARVAQGRGPVITLSLALAAVLILVFAGVAFWLWTWPAGQSWRATSGSIVALPVGQVVQPSKSTRVRIARIGWMDIAAQSAVTLLSTRSNEHRLAMTAGRVHVSVWAPPGSVALRTPSGNVIDLGCEFIVNADATRTSVDVVSGWVQLDNEVGEVVVPGGATSEMRRSRRPSVPVFRTATAPFQVAMRQLDDRSDAPASALGIVLQQARRRDVFTLLILAMRRPSDRDVILTRAAQLLPPRDETVLVRARRGDDGAVWEWVHELPLPPEKGWIRNWRDRFPKTR